MAQGTASAYHYSGRIAFDIGDVPFSGYGSYLAFSKLSGTKAPDAVSGVYLRNMHGSSDAEHPAFRVELLAGDSPLAFETTASPGRLHLSATAGSVDICLSGANRVLFHGQGVSLRFVPVGEAVVVPNHNNHWEIHGTSQYHEKYMLWAVAGELRVSEVWTGKVSQNVSAAYLPDPKSRVFEGEIDTYDSVWTAPLGGGDFAATVESVKTDYAHWLQRMPTVPSEFGPGAELAAYVNWTSVVVPMGFLGRPAMLMSKNWMANVWSWDQCFNAMALSLSDPELAWQQMEIPFDNQESHGALPDHIRDSSRTFTYTKPPIHGWALLWMMKRGGYKDVKHLGEIYGPLSRWTEWYFRYRDSNGDGLPEYDHGNDSGWDNSTVMLSGIPIESPDLDSYLILQMDALSTVAGMLGRNQEAKLWHSRSESLLIKMIATLWRDDHFVAMRADNGQELESESLLLYMPLVLGKRLPIAVQEKLVEGLTRHGRFRTSAFRAKRLPVTTTRPMATGGGQSGHRPQCSWPKGWIRLENIALRTICAWTSAKWCRSLECLRTSMRRLASA
jgi:hypothetical protein